MRSPPTESPRPARHRGFTLVEMIIAITLLGILATVAVPLIRMPMIGYMEATARAHVTTNLDWVQSKLNADLATALPNSIRVRQVGARYFIEFLQVHAHGRYLAGDPTPAAQTCPATPSCTGTYPDQFVFGTSPACTESCFLALGPLTTVGGASVVLNSDLVVVNPTNTAGVSGDPYANDVLPAIQSIKSRVLTVTPRVTMTPHAFPNIALPAGESPRAKRFYVIGSSPVTYTCDTATGSIMRYWNYNITPVQPTVFGVGISSAALSTGVSCSITAATSVVESAGMRGRGGLVTLKMTLNAPITNGGVAERVELILSTAVNDG
jgi:MSHA biogenesis protein MshO